MPDLEIFTDKIAESGRRLIRKSYDEAKSRDHNQLAAEHVLFSVAKTERSFFNDVMQSLNLDSQVVLEVLEKQLSRHEYVSHGIKMSESFRILLSNALKQAHENTRHTIESIDLFAAIFKDRTGVCTQLFQQLGATPEVVVQQIQKQIRSNKPVDTQPPSNQRGL
jgi:ATP-dependent Clp protease ATP-binding subunit ClpA